MTSEKRSSENQNLKVEGRIFEINEQRPPKRSSKNQKYFVKPAEQQNVPSIFNIKSS
jgi:hypothetical protein